MQLNRIDDALLIAQTCLKLDPFSGQVQSLVNSLQSIKSQTAAFATPQPRNELQIMEEQFRANPGNPQAALELAKGYAQSQQPEKANQVLDTLLAGSNVPPSVVIQSAQIYGQLANWGKLEGTLERLVQVSPESPEAWYDLAALKANMRKNADALPALTHAVDLSAKRLQHDPKARDLVAEARKDERFTLLRPTPEFQKLVPPK